MRANEIWKSRESKTGTLKTIGRNANGSIALTFQVDKLNPNSIHNFQEDYLNQYYEPTGVIQNWMIDNKLANLSNEVMGKNS